MDARIDSGTTPAVGIIMGSDSDWKTMACAAQVLDAHGVAYAKHVVSAHRTPDDLFEYAAKAEQSGLQLIIAGAGGAAHLPGMTASKTIVPVVGVPVIATPLAGFDALLSIMQMPAGVGVATVGVGPEGAANAARFAIAALAANNPRPQPALGAAVGKVAILVQDDDLPVMEYAEQYLARIGVPYRKASLDPTMPPLTMKGRLADLEADGTVVVIAGCRDGIEFARQIALATMLPVLAVPIVSEPVRCVDEFLRPFLKMPPGLATFALGKPGAINAAIFAATIASAPGSDVREKLHQMRKEQEARVRAMQV